MSSTSSPPGPWRLTLYAAWQVLLALPCLLLFVFTVVGGTLAIASIGLAIIVWSVPALRWVADRHRVMAARILQAPVPDDYRPVPPGSHLVTRITTWARDPMTWRDLAWAMFSMTAGFTISLLTVLLLVCVVTGAVWWYAAVPLMRARAALDRSFLSYGHAERLERRVAALTETRAELVDHSAAELRRLERDLHDGAQARLVALSMSLGLADEAFDGDVETARRMVGEARATTAAAIGDLRSVVRGIHPPVLADRGLGGAVEALALDMPIPVTVESRLPGRPPAPVESALYFGVAECLANIGKHAGASRAWIELRHGDGVLRAVVGDDGRGGAAPDRGTGMLGVLRRLSAFDGTMSVSSPAGGPTIVILEVPCDLSSPKTMPSSAPG